MRPATWAVFTPLRRCRCLLSSREAGRSFALERHGGGSSSGGGTGGGQTVTTDPTGSVIAGETVTTGTSLSGDVAVDPDTGESAGPLVDSAVSDVPIGAVVPTEIAARSGWGVSVVVLLLIVALTVALVLAPAFALRRLDAAGRR